MSRALHILLGILLAALVVPSAAAAEDDGPDRIVVKRRTGLTAAERADIRQDAGVTLEATLPLTGVEVVLPKDGDGDRALAELRADPDVRWAEGDELRQSAADPLAGLLWGLSNTGRRVGGYSGTVDADIDAPEAWTVTRGAGATVAVVDTGIDAGHPDLAARTMAGYDWVDDDADPTDANGHGTHVAGTIAASENGVGVVGVAPEARVIPLRVLNANGSGWMSDVAAAFAWAGDHGVRVVNASLGAAGATLTEQQAIREHPGTLYVVAAGNDGVDVDTTPRYPCAYPEPNVLCVGATTSRDTLAYFSNTGAAGVDLFAPGVGIVSDWPRSLASRFDADFEVGNGYELLQGTSMATPHVAGAAALVAAAHPDYSAAQIKAALMNTADAVPALAGKAVVGGRLNAAAALGAPAPAPTDRTRPSAVADVTATAGVETASLDWADAGDTDVVGYRVYQRAASGYWNDLPVASPSASEVVVSGLQGGRTYSFRVAAVDAAGNESSLTLAPAVTPIAAQSAPADSAEPVNAPDPATADEAAPTPAADPQPQQAAPSVPLPVAPIVTPAPVAAPAPIPAPAPAPARLAHVRVVGRVVLCARRSCARAATVTFAASAEANVGVRLRRLTCAGKTCRWTTAGTKTVHVERGTTRWQATRTLVGLPLRAGRYELALTAPGSRAVVRLAVTSEPRR
jgi:thermitase